MRTILAMSCAMACIAATARAEPVQLGEAAAGYTYYNRPGATSSDHNNDLYACKVATGFSSYEQVVEADRQRLQNRKPGPGPIWEAPVWGMVWNGPVAGMYASRVENCMLVRGWRVVRLPDAEGAALAALPDTAMLERLGPMFGVDSPPGEIVKAWANQGAHPADIRVAAMARAPDAKQLSLRLLADGLVTEPPRDPAQPMGGATQASPSAKATGPAAKPAPKRPAKWPTKPLAPKQAGSAPQGAAFLLVRVSDIGSISTDGLYFARRPPQSGEAMVDGPWAVKVDGGWTLLALPPGRWRISGVGPLGYCMGAPDFELTAGQVVYAGTFALKGETLGPDLGPEPARAYLAGAPLADQLQIAQYQNGSRGPCGQSMPYALEFDGAPFDPSYRWGSRAK